MIKTTRWLSVVKTNTQCLHLEYFGLNQLATQLSRSTALATAELGHVLYF